MHTSYTVGLTTAEYRAFEYVSSDVEFWISNAAKNRARKAIDEIVSMNTQYCNANSIQIAVGTTAQVNQAYDLGVIQTVAQKTSAFIST